MKGGTIVDQKPTAEDVDQGNPKEEPEVTDEYITYMWTAIDNMDVTSLDMKFIEMFEYKGFVPTPRTVMKRRTNIVHKPTTIDTVSRTTEGNPKEITTTTTSTKRQREEIEVTDEDIWKVWTDISNFDVTTLDRRLFEMFEYKGFDPKTVMKSLLLAKSRNNVSEEDFKTDMLILCSVAAIKGSVNDHNVKKLCSEGLTELVRLESLYDIKRGGCRNEDRTTISRIGDTFPNKIVELINSGRILSRKFDGPFKSAFLPNVMRHNAFASVVPMTLNGKVKTFLLEMVTAFSTEQSMCISSGKAESEDIRTVFWRQRNFVQVAHDSIYPSSAVREKVFKTLLLDYDAIVVCSKATLKIMDHLMVPSREEFNNAVSSI